MKPSAFEYIKPTSIDAALQALAKHQMDDVKIIAGGQSLVPMMNFRIAAPEILVDLGGIPDLVGIAEEPDWLCIGAMTTAAQVKASGIVAQTAPLITMAYEHVAHVAIRNRGTLGGNLCHCDPASEMPMVMLLLDAEFEIAGQTGTRRVSAHDFFFGMYTTAVEPDEILTEIRIPVADRNTGFAFDEVSLRKGDFAMVAVGVRLDTVDGQCEKLAIGLAGVDDVALCFSDFDGIAQARPLSEISAPEVADAVTSRLKFHSTASQSAAFRRDTTRALTQRVFAQCLKAKKS